jgi:hypothetical protein
VRPCASQQNTGVMVRGLCRYQHCGKRYGPTLSLLICTYMSPSLCCSTNDTMFCLKVPSCTAATCTASVATSEAPWASMKRFRCLCRSLSVPSCLFWECLFWQAVQPLQALASSCSQQQHALLPMLKSTGSAHAIEHCPCLLFPPRVAAVCLYSHSCTCNAQSVRLNMGQSSQIDSGKVHDAHPPLRMFKDVVD